MTYEWFFANLGAFSSKYINWFNCALALWHYHYHHRRVRGLLHLRFINVMGLYIRVVRFLWVTIIHSFWTMFFRRIHICTCLGVLCSCCIWIWTTAAYFTIITHPTVILIYLFTTGVIYSSVWEHLWCKYAIRSACEVHETGTNSHVEGMCRDSSILYMFSIYYVYVAIKISTKHA